MNKAAITLLIAMLILVTIGVVMLFSTPVRLQARDRYGDSNSPAQTPGWFGWRLAACCALSWPRRRTRNSGRSARPAFARSLYRAAPRVLIPHIGIKVGGARRWLGLGSFRFQPSEFAKLGLIVWLAHYLAKEKRRIEKFKRGFLIPMAVVGVMCLLVLAEPDFGTTALMGSVAFAMMFIAGVRLRYLVPTLLSGDWRRSKPSTLIMHNLRFGCGACWPLTDLEKYKAGAGYQVSRQCSASGSGGVNGLGLGNSRQKMFYLPEAHTDFIFPIVGEGISRPDRHVERARVFCGLLVACGVIIATRAPDLFGQYLSVSGTILMHLVCRR